MKIKLNGVRLAFPVLFKPEQVNGEGEPAYSATFLIPKSDTKLIAEINAGIDKVAKEKWGEKAAATLKTLRSTDKVCLRDGDAKTDYAGFEDHFFVGARNKVKPTVINRDRSPVGETDGTVYAGCYVSAIVELWAQDNKYGKRVNATLGGVQFVRDGMAFAGGRAASADEFDDISEGADAEGAESLI